MLNRPLLGIVREDAGPSAAVTSEAEVMSRIGEVMRSGAVELEDSPLGRDLCRLATVWQLASLGAALSDVAHAL